MCVLSFDIILIFFFVFFCKFKYLVKCKLDFWLVIDKDMWLNFVWKMLKSLNFMYESLNLKFLF